MVAGTLTPTQSDTLPPIGAITITVRATGKINSPTLEGEYPKIICKKKGMTKLWAPFIQKEKRLAPREERKSCFLKMLRSTRGDEERCSTTMNRPKQSRERKSQPQKKGEDFQPTRFRKRSSVATKRKNRRAPRRSSCVLPVVRSPFRIFEERMVPMAPMGRLMKKIDSHPKCSTKKPPINGPVINPKETTEPSIPRAFPRSFSGKAVATIAGPMAIKADAPRQIGRASCRERV